MKLLRVSQRVAVYEVVLITSKTLAFICQRAKQSSGVFANRSIKRTG